VEAVPKRAAPGQPFTLHGKGFVGDVVCDDAGTAGSGGNSSRALPARDVRLEFRQGGETWELGTVDAGRGLGFDARVEVPKEAEPGHATLRAVEGVPSETTFRVVSAPTETPDGSTVPDAGPPRATLSFGDRTETGELGSYCWGYECVDAAGHFVAPEKDSMLVTTGSEMVFEFGGKASSVEAQAVPFDRGDVRRMPGPEGISLIGTEGSRGRPQVEILEVRRSPGRTLIDASLPPGEHVLVVFVRAPQGTASYDFRLWVEP